MSFLPYFLEKSLYWRVIMMIQGLWLNSDYKYIHCKAKKAIGYLKFINGFILRLSFFSHHLKLLFSFYFFTQFWHILFKKMEKKHWETMGNLADKSEKGRKFSNNSTKMLKNGIFLIFFYSNRENIRILDCIKFLFSIKFNGFFFFSKFFQIL